MNDDRSTNGDEAADEANEEPALTERNSRTVQAEEELEDAPGVDSE